MALFQIQFFSNALNVASTVNVIMPEPDQGIGIGASEETDLPKVLYLLHGYSDDQSIWIRRTSVERYAAAHNLAVIMPAVNHSFYCNEVHGERYWDYVSEELPRAMYRFLKISDRPEDTFVAGLSMGGYGAMRLALTWPERFAAAASFSGAVDIARIFIRHTEDGTAERIFGNAKDVSGSEVDLMHLMKVNGKALSKPRLYVSCGTKDFLYESHQAFVPALIENGWEVIRHDEPNAVHSWDLWDREIKKFIEMIFQ